MVHRYAAEQDELNFAGENFLLQPKLLVPSVSLSQFFINVQNLAEPFHCKRFVILYCVSRVGNFNWLQIRQKYSSSVAWQYRQILKDFGFTFDFLSFSCTPLHHLIRIIQRNWRKYCSSSHTAFTTV